jgi:hypothetical protein
MRDTIVGSATEGSIADGQAMIFAIEHAAWRYTAVRALVSVGCPQELRDGPRAVSELADRCGADGPTLARLLRAVAQTGLVRSVPPGSYELTTAGRALLEGRPLLSIQYSIDPEIWGAFGELTETVRTGKAPFVERHGSLYNYLAGNPGLSAIFDAFMNVNYWQLAVKVAAAGGFQAGETVVDVGGGQGTFLAAILQANPGVRGILLDLARTMPAAEEYLPARGVADRCELVAGDFFQAVPEGGPVLEVSGLTRFYGTHSAIENITFQVARGELVTIVGPSGCGKSTLMRCIAASAAGVRGRRWRFPLSSRWDWPLPRGSTRGSSRVACSSGWQ